MKKLSIMLFFFLFISATFFSQTEEYNLASENLHHKVRKTRTNYYAYDTKSGGFVLRSVSIYRYNDEGNLEETFYQYYGSFTKTDPSKKLYNYNSKNQLISIKDVSPKKSNYATDLQFFYNKAGNLIKKTSVYQNGDTYNYIYTYDKKDNRITAKEYSKDNKLTSETYYRYDGKTKTENKTSYSAKDGSIYGSYTTVYKDGKKVSYSSESSYGNTKTDYEYDKEDNLIKSTLTGKKVTVTNYDYVYDNKDNWIKKHYRSGQYQSFYFREILLDNGTINGSADFDPNFINLHGNFANVNVVPVVMTKIKTNTTNNNTTTNNSTTFSNKKWDFDYVYINDEVKKLAGDVTIKTSDASNIRLNSTVKISVQFRGQKFDLTFTVSKSNSLADKHEYILTNAQNAKAVLWIYKKEKPLKDEKTGTIFNVNGLLSIAEVDQPAFSMYFK